MKLYRKKEIKHGDYKESVIAIGNFDGVHKGHQDILQRLAKAKEHFQAPSLVYTFEPHPVRVLNPQKGMKMIFDYKQRVELLSRYNPDALVIAEFDENLASMKAEDFVKNILVDLFKVRKVVVGYDFNFGSGGDGDAGHLAKIGKKFGYEVEQAPAVMIDDRPISSSRIRRLVKAGELMMVSSMLGRPFFLVGTVVKGHSRGGHILGIPTANLSTQQEIIPAKGVYAALVKTPGGIFGGAVNVGTNPTFDNGGLSIEAHILDFSGELYDTEIEIHFLRRLRDEKRFQSIDRLKEQMDRDIEIAGKITGEVDSRIILR